MRILWQPERIRRSASASGEEAVFFAVGAFLLGAAAVAPFSKGGSLHQYAKPFGGLLVFLAFGSFVALVYCVALLWGAYRIGSSRSEGVMKTSTAKCVQIETWAVYGVRRFLGADL